MDVDETMTTSTSSSADLNSGDQGPNFDDDEDDNLFPGNGASPAGAARPHTPANDHLNATAPGELSPPRSHTQQAQPVSYDKGEALNGHDLPQTSSSLIAEASQATNDPLEDRPGYAWKNKKAQEEMQRAWDHVVDRDFSLKEYGDVMMQGNAM